MQTNIFDEYKLEVIESATLLDISLTDLKNFLRLDVSDSSDDKLLTTIVKTVSDRCKSYLNISLLQSKYRLTVDASGQNNFCLPRPPIASIESIAYISNLGSSVVIDQSLYGLDPIRNILRTNFGGIGFGSGVLQIIYSAGYRDWKEIPSLIYQGIIMESAEIYNGRGAAIDFSKANNLWESFRVNHFIL